jgi:hypothetical protein
MNNDFWGMFHDGVIDHIDIAVNGGVEVFVEIDYIRK